jgi:hypothetical protein
MSIAIPLLPVGPSWLVIDDLYPTYGRIKVFKNLKLTAWGLNPVAHTQTFTLGGFCPSATTHLLSNLLPITTVAIHIFKF